MQARIREAIESTTTGFTAGAYELLEAPPFGALIRAQTRVRFDATWISPLSFAIRALCYAVNWMISPCCLLLCAIWVMPFTSN